MHTSRAFSCGSEWRMTASGTSSHRSCHSSGSRPGRIQLWAWGRCTGSRWLYTPRNPLHAPGSEHVACPHTYKWYVLALRHRKYQFQSQDGRTAAVLCDKLWRHNLVVTVHNQVDQSALLHLMALNKTQRDALKQSHITAIRALMRVWPFLLLLAQSSRLQ